MKHILVSRVAIKMNHPNQTMDWETWALKRLELYRTITIPSIAAQSNQDFTLISLVDEDFYMKYGGDGFMYHGLDNEVTLLVKSDGSYPKKNIVKVITKYIASFDDDEVIVSRIDSDDLLHIDYIKEVRAAFNTKEKRDYVDIKVGMTYNINTGKAFLNKKYDVVISPFVSVREPVNQFDCLSFAFEHSQLSFLTGIKSERIKAVQIIHGNNLINKESGIDITNKFMFNEYGGYFS